MEMTSKATDPTMKTGQPEEPASSRTGGQQARELRIVRELADTTWRIAVPVLLFAGVGIFADRNWGSKPWLTLLGTAIGFVCAALLVKRQLERWPDMPVRPGSYERNRRPGDDEDKDYYND